jgi:hypothetical protein
MPDREARHQSGCEQWYSVGAGDRVDRHTLVGVRSAGHLTPLLDASGFVYVGVAGAGAMPGGGAGNAAGERRIPVLQHGELTFDYLGAAAQGVVGQVAYCVDERTVTADPNVTTQRYAVGRITTLTWGNGLLLGPSPARHGTPTGVRVDITGYATTALLVYLSQWRAEFSLPPHTLSGLTLGCNYRIGVTLPYSFANLTYSGELVCGVEKVDINRDTARKAENHCGWNIYLPPDTPDADYYGVRDLVVTPYFEGRGWNGPVVGVSGVWDAVTEIL